MSSSRRPTTGRRSAVLDLVEGVVVSVDGAALTCPFDPRHVVFAREQADVVDLGDASREQLDRACGEIPLIVAAKRRVVRAIELVNIDLARMSVDRIRLTLPPCVAPPIGEGDSSPPGSRMPSRSGRTGIPSWQSRLVNCRSGERARCAARRSGRRFRRRAGAARQDEVVRPVAVRAQPFVGRIPIVDFGKHDEPERIGDAGDPRQELVDLGLDHEAGRARLLDDVSDGIEPDDPDAAIGERAQPPRDQRAGRGRGDVEIDLLGPVGGPEGRPDGSCWPVSSIVTVENGRCGLRRKIRATSSSGGSPSARPCRG